MLKSDIDKINDLGQRKYPFLLVIDFACTRCEIISDFSACDISFSMDESSSKDFVNKNIHLKKYPSSLKSYEKQFNKIIQYIKKGHTYFLNLSLKTQIKTDLNLKQIYAQSKAKFKLRFKDEFVCFSPERFIKIQNQEISAYPMKGTIDANIKNAKKKILENKKETAEHTMVVDLLRNDLSMVAKEVRVKKFRFVEEIDAGETKLLQVSSQICGKLDKPWNKNIGTILDRLLPAGSICGAPKRETLKIINEVEDYSRDFYTGVFVYFDGKNLDSAVMIRFIQKEGEKLFYKSGGGLTIDSLATSEYEEILAKIYLS